MNTKAKQQEAGPYVALGISKTDDNKYLILELKVSGLEVQKRTVLKECVNYAEAMYEYRIAAGTFSINYLNKHLEGK